MREKPARPKGRAAREPEPEIAIVGELFEESESQIMSDLLEVPRGERLTIYIDSAGGSVYAALSIAALIRYRKLRTTAIVLGECSSSAILIFAACQKRFVTPRSVFLFHRVRWRSDKDVRSEEAAHWATHFRWLEEEIDRYQADLFGHSTEIFAPWVEQGRFVLGTELVELGIADRIDV